MVLYSLITATRRILLVVSSCFEEVRILGGVLMLPILQYVCVREAQINHFIYTLILRCRYDLYCKSVIFEVVFYHILTCWWLAEQIVLHVIPVTQGECSFPQFFFAFSHNILKYLVWYGSTVLPQCMLCINQLRTSCCFDYIQPL